MRQRESERWRKYRQVENINISGGDKIEKRLKFLEETFIKFGAVETDIISQGDDFQRKVFLKGDRYYKAGTLKFPDSDEMYLVISCTDEEKYAHLGIMDDVDAFAANLTDYELEEKVRFAFGID